MNFRSLIHIILSLLLSTPALTGASGPAGWAAVEGHGVKTTSGGGDGVAVTVTTMDELNRLVSQEEPQVILISGKISTGPRAIRIRSNKTLRGADKDATIHGGLDIRDASNIIVSNLNIQGAGPGNDPADGIAARSSHHLWFDHLNIRDSRDGNLDLTVGCDFLTVSWCRFSYADATNDHRLSCLVGGGSTHGATDTGKNRVTYHHNWFAELVQERMPRVLFGQAHIYNNLYASVGNNYCIGVGSFASALIEKNYFKGVKSPHRFADTNRSFITARENEYDNTTGKQETGSGGMEGPEVAPFTEPPYAYSADPAKDVPGLVMKASGPQ